MSNQNNKNVIVCLGAGRSGTSLLMQILNALGVNLSSNVVESRLHNPKGTQEDIAIANTYEQFLQNNNWSRKLPFIFESFNEQSIEQTKRKLKNILVSNLESSDGIWGFKEPVNSLMIPVWRRVFNQAAVIPKYILCVRNPASVVNSYESNFSENRATAELRWLEMTVQSLIQTGGNVFIVHYENWFSEDAETVAVSLAKYLDLDCSPQKIKDELNKVLFPELNREQWKETKINNRYVRRVYKELLNSRGENFDRETLLATVHDANNAMREFIGWPLAAKHLVDEKVASSHIKQSKLEGKLIEFQSLLKASLLNENRLHKENFDLNYKLSKASLSVPSERGSGDFNSSEDNKLKERILFLEKRLAKSRKNMEKKNRLIEELSRQNSHQNNFFAEFFSKIVSRLKKV